MKSLISNVNIYGLQESIKAAKYPMSVDVDSLSTTITPGIEKLATCEKGTGHDQFLTGITVQFDLTCTNKMWVEMERYRFVNFVSSQSTMHRIEQFSLGDDAFSPYTDDYMVMRFRDMVEAYNSASEKTPEDRLKLLYSCPSGFRLTARLTTNYRQLKTIYAQRKNHRLPEWREFCKWLETLPYANWITGKDIQEEMYQKDLDEQEEE